MAVFKVSTLVVEPEKQEEFITLIKKWVAMTERNKETYKELKSYKLFTQMFGDNRGHVEMWEFENLADYEKCHNRMKQDKEFLTILPLLYNCIIPSTHSTKIWNSVI